MSEDVVEAVKKIELVHNAAKILVAEWFPDTQKYERQKRIATLSVMKMIIDAIELEKLKRKG